MVESLAMEVLGEALLQVQLALFWSATLSSSPPLCVHVCVHHSVSMSLCTSFVAVIVMHSFNLVFVCRPRRSLPLSSHRRTHPSWVFDSMHSLLIVLVRE